MAKQTNTDMQGDQRLPVLPAVTADLTGKTVVVTGANIGLGYEAAKHFAKMGPARLIIACRSQEKGEKALKDIEAVHGFDSGKTKLELWLVDLANFASVVEFGDKFEKDGGKVDILVSNAGVISPEYRSTVDGWEEILQVNHISTALLSLLLLPRLQAASVDSTPRLVIVSSAVHFLTTLAPALSSPNILAELSKNTTPFDIAKRYETSKLLNVFFTRALASRLAASSRVVVNCVNPGYCVSALARDLNHSPPGLVAHTTEEGSRQLVWAAVGGRDEELRGAYISRMEVREPSDEVLGEEGKATETRVWDDTMKILRELTPKVEEVLQSL